ncbi:GNAT family N-acetyltransferase [Algoriphagus sp. AGSA1]|uniref:GNAT family N-acetyltransferase n=1 Tax=Algoriphagus sp. AGSA1 TaxID=2907213 RepID=UPI001F17F9ED|nr:GNAT family N-acetyltransferase [Algoriphagus sp. AGSA1]MCE7055639.1 GNAT family N-acetyltransferase [Algoriphagus sp. AGSA1]
MNKEQKIRIVVREASWEELLVIHRLIPEFHEKIGEDFYKKRLENVHHLALVAEVKGELIGFKVGYQHERLETFYSWMGGVLPGFRKSGVATALADYMEKWAKQNGFKQIFFKTRNRFPAMISFGLGRGFRVIGVRQKGEVDDYRIVMLKEL